MEVSTMKPTRERVDSLVTDQANTDVSPISPVDFDHALQQLESDLGLQESPSRNYNQTFSAAEERQQGQYGPVANNLFSSRPLWSPAESKLEQNELKVNCAEADIPPLALNSRHTITSPSRLSIDGSNLEVMSDHARYLANKSSQNFRHSLAISEHVAGAETGNMKGLKRSKRANFNRPAPRRLQQRRNSERSLSLSPISSCPSEVSTPATPEMSFRFEEPLKTSPQQLPRLIIPNRRKKSSAADERGFESPPPLPAYSTSRPRRMSTDGAREIVSMSPKAKAVEWTPTLTRIDTSLDTVIQSTLEHAEAGEDVSTPVLHIDLPGMSPSNTLPRHNQLQAIQETDLFDDSPTLPRSQMLPDILRAGRPSQPRPQPALPEPQPVRAAATTRQRPMTTLEPYIVSSSPVDDRFFTISDYFTEDSPYETKQYYSLRRKLQPPPLSSHPLMRQASDNHSDDSFTDEEDYHDQDQAMNLRDYVKAILRRSNSQRQSTSQWNRPIDESSFLFSDDDDEDEDSSRASSSNRNSGDSSIIAIALDHEDSNQIGDRPARPSSSAGSVSSVSSMSECSTSPTSTSSTPPATPTIIVHDYDQDKKLVEIVAGPDEVSVHDEHHPSEESAAEVSNLPIDDDDDTTTSSPKLPAITITTTVLPTPPPPTERKNSIVSIADSPDSPITDDDKECRVCGDLFPIHRYHSKPTSNCQHDAEACRPCLSRWVKAKITQRDEWLALQQQRVVLGCADSPVTATQKMEGFVIKCPALMCGMLLSEDDVQAVADMRTKP